MLAEEKRAMPEDSVEALMALERIVSAEQEMRSGTVDGQPCSETASKIFFKAVSSGSDVSRGAVASQLAGSAFLHSQTEPFEQKKQIVEQAQQLCRKRLQGLCGDAKVLGRAYATASESKSDEHSRKSMLESLDELQEKMSQTEDLVWIIQGESRGINERQKRLNTSALLCSFFSEVAVYNPVAGSRLFAERKDMLVTADAELVADILLRSSSESAYNVISRGIETDDPKERLDALCTCCEEVSADALEISEKSYALLLNRVEAERVQTLQLDKLFTAVTRKNVAREVCEFLVRGDRVAALSVLYCSQDFSEREKQQVIDVIRQQQWVTEPSIFIEAFAASVECERGAEPCCIFPADSLSPYDALLLYDLLGEYSPKTQFENEQLLSLLYSFQATKNKTEPSSIFTKNKNIGVADKQKRAVSDMTVLRYVLDAIVSARKENKDVLTILHTIEKEAF
ncbi:hypothetical protein [Halodesulfovibrio aestuarii]|uniref:Uncharacterized protein n=1 Tax=Halodesulfovibrio aestuarii TaxID=126333 RepID=A0ABV4JVQ6_9BACT